MSFDYQIGELFPYEGRISSTYRVEYRVPLEERSQPWTPLKRKIEEQTKRKTDEKLVNATIESNPPIIDSTEDSTFEFDLCHVDSSHYVTARCVETGKFDIFLMHPIVRPYRLDNIRDCKLVELNEKFSGSEHRRRTNKARIHHNIVFHYIESKEKLEKMKETGTENAIKARPLIEMAGPANNISSFPSAPPLDHSSPSPTLISSPSVGFPTVLVELILPFRYYRQSVSRYKKLMKYSLKLKGKKRTREEENSHQPEEIEPLQSIKNPFKKYRLDFPHSTSEESSEAESLCKQENSSEGKEEQMRSEEKPDSSSFCMAKLFPLSEHPDLQRFKLEQTAVFHEELIRIIQEHNEKEWAPYMINDSSRNSAELPASNAEDNKKSAKQVIAKSILDFDHAAFRSLMSLSRFRYRFSWVFKSLEKPLQRRLEEMMGEYYSEQRVQKGQLVGNNCLGLLPQPEATKLAPLFQFYQANNLEYSNRPGFVMGIPQGIFFPHGPFFLSPPIPAALYPVPVSQNACQWATFA